MIEVNRASSNRPEKFQTYDDLFEHLVEVENQKMLERRPDFKSMQWSFTAYAPHHVQALYAHLKGQHPVVCHASENKLPLLEICSGDFTNPEYVVGTENTKRDTITQCFDCSAPHSCKRSACMTRQSQAGIFCFYLSSQFLFDGSKKL